MRAFAGIDLRAVEPTFKPAKPGRVLIFDGDAAAYKAAATVKQLDTAVRRFFTDVLTEMFVTQSASARVYLTSADCTKLYRYAYPSLRPYQGNRTNKAKPPLLEALRERLASGQVELPDGVDVYLHRHMEADDAMRVDAEILGKAGDVVISSEDKDLRQLTQPYFERSTGRIDVLAEPFGWVDVGRTPAGAAKAVGHGHAFVLAQWLMGDTADNVRGLHKYQGGNCGLVTAVELVQRWGSVQECVLQTLRAYASIPQDPLAELEMLWLGVGRVIARTCGYRS